MIFSLNVFADMEDDTSTQIQTPEERCIESGNVWEDGICKASQEEMSTESESYGSED